LLGTVTTVLVLAEVALRLLPVATGLRTVPVVADNPVFHFTPNRDFVFSRDWDMALPNQGRVNNAGFVSDRDYHTAGAEPLLAIIGDSYIEAAMVPYRETISGRLSRALEGRLRVYSFAASGAPLSQYLIWARHATREFGASALVIAVIGNDFDESLAAYKTGPGFWHYVRDSDNTLRLRLFEYRPGMLREIVLASALARYLVFNMQIGALWSDIRSWFLGGQAMAAPHYAGNTASDASPKRVADSLAAIDAFLRDLPEYSALSPDRILFILDGSRYPEIAAASAGSYFEIMRKAFMEKARARGYDAIDLDPLFFEHHLRTGERFEYTRDGHWNSVGHGIAAQAVVGSSFMGRLGLGARL
jgi:hypothetical protein